MGDKFIAWLIEKGIISAENADEAREMAKTMNTPEKGQTPPPSASASTQAAPAGYVSLSEVAGIVEKAVADATAPFAKKLDEEKAARETLAQERAKKQEEELKTKVAAALKEAQDSGRLTSKESVDKWEKRLLENFPSWKDALDEMLPNPAVNRDGKKAAPGNTSDKKTDVSAGAAPFGKTSRQELFESAASVFGGSGE